MEKINQENTINPNNQIVPCKCVSEKIARGQSGNEILIHCQKCDRMVVAKSLEEALGKWNPSLQATIGI